jgi:hypothetical protein
MPSAVVNRVWSPRIASRIKRTHGKHALGRFPEGDGDDPLALREPFAGAEEKRNTGPAPMIEHFKAMKVSVR